MPNRVLIVDDQRMFREGIRNRLEREQDIQVVGEASSAEEAITLVEEIGPNIAIIDIRLPNISGIELARILKSRWPELRVLMLTGYDFDQYVRAAVKIGVDGYMLKDSPQDDLVQALRTISRGEAVLPPRIASKVIRSYATYSPTPLDRELNDLTMRELEILELLYQGLRNNEIAQRLSISPRTVEAHVSSIISKLGVESRTDAVRTAVERNLIK